MVSPGVFPASADRLQFQNGDRHRRFCFLIVTAAAERTPAFLAFELGWARLGVGKSSGRRWGRIDEASEGGGKERAFGWGRRRPRPSGRVWLQLRASLRSDVLQGFRLRLSWSFLAEVLREGKRSDFSLGLKPAVLCGRPYDFLPCSSLPFAVPISLSRHSAPEGLIRRQRWFLSLGCCVFSFLARGFAAVSG